MGISVLLLANSFSQDSFGFGDYDYLFDWGSFGITGAGSFSHPQFVAVGPDGSVYVSDLGNKRVQKFTSQGDYITEWGKSGKASGEFHYPSGIAVYNGYVFVADRDLNRVQKFTTNGEFISEWGEKGIYEGQFSFPNGIVVNNGIVYVVDTGNQRIQAFTIDGNFVSSFGSSGLGEGQFLTAVGIATDDDGNIYVTDKGNGKIEKFSGTGKHLKSLPFYYSNYAFTPEAIAVDPEGGMFVVNSANNLILHLSQESDSRLSIFDQLGPYDSDFKIITDVTLGINGELFVVDSAEHNIKSYETPFYTEPILIDGVPVPVIVEPVFHDDTKPVIVAPTSLKVEATDYYTSVSIGNANATDEGGIKDIINNAPDAYPPGISTVLWVAFDYAGYSASATQTINVQACGEDTVTYNIIEGTEGDDVIRGTDGSDLIFGLSGDDLISGGLGNDCIYGGDGNDLISGGAGDDTLRGNSGYDVLRGDLGSDLIYANSGADIVDGGNNSDRCYSDSENDLLVNCE